MVSFEHDGQREIGYWIGREFWGRGWHPGVVDFLGCRNALPLRGVVPRNAASIRVLEKCGFK